MTVFKERAFKFDKYEIGVFAATDERTGWILEGSKR